MASISGRFEFPDGLTPGQSKDGGLHQNLYDDQGRLVDHATFIPDDDDDADPPVDPPPLSFDTNERARESDPRARGRLDPEEVIEALIILIKVADSAAPHIKRWWNDQALPLMKSTRSRFARNRKNAGRDKPTESTVPLVEPVPSMPSREEIDELEKEHVRMSSEEASARLAAALTAKLFSDEQMRILRSARIDNENDASESSQLGSVLPGQIADHVRLALETNPSLLTEDPLAFLGKILASIQAEDAVHAIER
ncbi:hypothetical protein [Streptomyces avidinii]|uniref:Uncharacterized protein n=1 Tax=Streptomyces avidinii TaxID=1895 RepID=A0ABS4L2W8_STRAV|nr:hypothetical protein [Streptomyces avidinii]MBP2035484.1 hypothetical protein [Streptomyces avidinii]GGZ02149.1 hypothetical protein GCM10010343_29720 [Streptomyces avidinii]